MGPARVLAQRCVGALFVFPSCVAMGSDCIMGFQCLLLNLWLHTWFLNGSRDQRRNRK